VFLVLLIGIPIALIVSGAPQKFLFEMPDAKDGARAAECKYNLNQLGKRLYDATHEEGFDPDAGWTVPDLIRESVHGGKLDETILHCPATGAPYSVFSIPAAVCAKHGGLVPAKLVPVAMCRPDAHRRRKGGFYFPKEYGAMVLYSDGHVARVSREEAERLLSGLSQQVPANESDEKPKEKTDE
jgi:prepilin-type processing-associated H-X9-DG protein